jgi:hypothetical protein
MRLRTWIVFLSFTSWPRILSFAGRSFIFPWRDCDVLKPRHLSFVFTLTREILRPFDKSWKNLHEFDEISAKLLLLFVLFRRFSGGRGAGA